MELFGIFYAELLTPEILKVLGVIYGLLIFFSTLFFAWGKIQPQKNLTELKKRTNSWWVMFTLVVGVLFINRLVAVIGLAFLSFIAIRELLSCLELRHSDRRLMLWCYVCIPIQFYFAYTGNYKAFMIFIPVVMFLFLPFRAVLIGDTVNVTNSFSVIQWSLMLTVFSISHLAYMLSFENNVHFSAGNGGLLLYLIFLTQFNDVLQFIWGKSFGKHKVLPRVSPNKTWEGLIGGVLSTTAIGYFLRFLTPLTEVESILVAFIIGVSGFCGDVVVSAIKRDYGIKDMGNTIPGHGGIMDRIDSLSYTSLIFVHVVYALAWN